MNPDQVGEVDEFDRQRALQEAVDPERAALLVIDVQKDFISTKQDDMLLRLARLIRTARAIDVKIIYIQNGVLPAGRSDSVADTRRRRTLGLPLDATIVGTDGHRFVAAIAPEDDDIVIPKHRMDAFAGTSLDLVLRANGLETIICTGVATHGCVTGTSYGAQARDLNVVVVRDCVGTWDGALHEAALTVLAGTMLAVVEARTLEELWSASTPQVGGSSRRSIATGHLAGLETRQASVHTERDPVAGNRQ